MINKFLFMCLIVGTSCQSKREDKPSVQITSTISATSRDTTDITDTTSFESFKSLFLPLEMPCTTYVVTDDRFTIPPVSIYCRFLNGFNNEKIVDFQAEPDSHVPCELYHNNCSAFPPANIKEMYNMGNLFLSGLGGVRIESPNKNFDFFLIRTSPKVKSSWLPNEDVYLFVYSKDGNFISGLQINAYCSNKVAAIIRTSVIDKDLNIFVTERQSNRDGECDEGDFEVKYLYRIAESGMIQKVSETIEVFPTGSLILVEDHPLRDK